jgi:hypothetical protein
MAVTGGESLGPANSAGKPVGCGEEREMSTPASNCEWGGSRSNVARALRDALAAIDAGKVQVAREGLEALLRLVR